MVCGPEASTSTRTRPCPGRIRRARPCRRRLDLPRCVLLVLVVGLAHAPPFHVFVAAADTVGENRVVRYSLQVSTLKRRTAGTILAARMVKRRVWAEAIAGRGFSVPFEASFGSPGLPGNIGANPLSVQNP